MVYHTHVLHATHRDMMVYHTHVLHATHRDDMYTHILHAPGVIHTCMPGIRKNQKPKTKKVPTGRTPIPDTSKYIPGNK